VGTCDDLVLDVACRFGMSVMSSQTLERGEEAVVSFAWWCGCVIASYLQEVSVSPPPLLVDPNCCQFQRLCEIVVSHKLGLDIWRW
jgi:hypothetical protein